MSSLLLNTHMLKIYKMSSTEWNIFGSKPPLSFQMNLTCVHFCEATISNISSTKPASVHKMLNTVKKNSELNCANREWVSLIEQQLCLIFHWEGKRCSADRVWVLQRAGRDWKPNGEERKKKLDPLSTEQDPCYSNSRSGQVLKMSISAWCLIKGWLF